MTSDIPVGRRAAVWAYPLTILRQAAKSRADGRTQSDGRIRIGIATGSGASARAQRSTGSLPYWELELVPGWRQISVDYIRTSTRGIWFFLVDLYRQNVVIVVADRSSRSARFATSSELLYLLNLLYNTSSECCDDYKLVQLIPEEFRVVFRFPTHIYLWVKSHCHRTVVTIGGETALSHAEQWTLTEIRT